MIWNLYKRAQRLAGKLAESAIDEPIDPELTQWQEESDEGKKTVDAFSRPELRTYLLAQFEHSEKRIAVQHLKKAIRKRKHIKFIRRVSAVAAIAAFLIGSSIFIYPFLKSPEPQTPIANIIPGSQQATLILANGEKINLSEVSQISESDGTAIKQTKQGEVSYHAGDHDNTTDHYNTIIVPRYGEYSVILSDGTRIKLNSESELRYPTVFPEARREVFLKGEAYLEVSKGDKPFIVHSYDAKIKVYGTHFDVNSYNPDQINVVLVEGKVGVSNQNQEEVILLPDQLALIDSQKGISIKKDINTDYYTAWQSGYFAFESERLEDILKNLSRWYNFEVLYNQPELKEIRFTASIKREQPLKDILQQFQKTGSVTYRISGNQIIIQ